MWTISILDFWSSLQHHDGSFDEAYPYERSLAATSFTGFYLGQAFQKLQSSEPNLQINHLIKTFTKLGDWLCQNSEHHGILSNHLSAAAAALQTAYEITSIDRYKERSSDFINRILAHQSREGWYEEYGGADVGYQSHTIFYLAHIWKKTRDPELFDSLKKSIKYFAYFVHPDGSLGGEYASRNTRFFLPAGFEILASEDEHAAAIAIFMRKSIAMDKSINLSNMDAQNVLPMINNYIYILDNFDSLTEHSKVELPFKKIFEKQFNDSGHAIFSTRKYYAIIALKKGGVLYICSKGNTTHSDVDAGVALKLQNGKILTTQGLNCTKIALLDKGEILLETELTEINQVTQSSFKFTLLRLLALTSLLHASFAIFTKRVLVNVLVSRRKRYKVFSIRNLKFSSNSVQITDHVKINKGFRLSNVYYGGRFSTIHMGSARYFEWQELSNFNPTEIIECKKPYNTKRQKKWEF